MVHKDIIQRKKYLEETVDKIIVCLVGQPRGISLKCWRYSLPVQFENTFYGRDNKDCLPHGVQTKRPEIHFVCSTWNEDSLDRYVGQFQTPLLHTAVPLAQSRCEQKRKHHRLRKPEPDDIAT